ncbi:hypothetical protein MKZ38_007786 [Zalerion maritima]|uniref:Deacetylase complex subunit protein n=1 Tax=Zalerion maritima TaxID=339359 RepID=A0AAD5RI96_9PEZI|nr:hypothetical protein MKZ38_007786 [Zalerion maritima]
MAAMDPGLPPSHTQVPHPKADRRRDVSPPPPSKRDRKRQQLVDRITTLSEKFAQNRDNMYRDQLQKIQIDTALVMRADPYADRPLDELEAEFPNHTQAAASDSGRPPTKSLLEMAGPKYHEWLNEVEDLVEVRDFDLTRQKYEYDRKCQEYRNTYAYKAEVAKREHKTLSDTLRDRLINTITAKKFRLNKEKEALEISDASALLLHPNQYSLANPASPGGNHGKRQTRLRREAEEGPTYNESKKRKRNVNDDEGSPAPGRHRLDPNATTVLWQTDRLKTNGGKHGTPTQTYSLDKLFTEKELLLTHNTAALAAHRHILTHGVGKDGLAAESPPGSGNEGNQDDNEEHLAAPMMERHHSTRSTRGGHAHHNFIDDKVLGLEALTSFDLPSNLEKVTSHEPKLPPLSGLQYAKGYGKTSEMNTPPSLPSEEISQDLAIMGMYKQYETIHGKGSNFAVENGGRKVLETCITPLQEGRFVSYHQGKRPEGESVRKGLGLPTNSNGNVKEDVHMVTPQKESDKDKAMGGLTPGQPPTSVPMSRQSSLGGVGMSRQGSGRGKRRG